LSSAYSRVRKLLATDQVDAFDCGQVALNQFLQRYALVNQKANSAQTYVCCQGDVVVGFYSLAVGSVDPQAAPLRVMKGLARHPVPVMILARLAVEKEHQRQGLGQALLKDALLRTAQAADIAGIRCLLVHAKDEAARQWYESWEFEPSPTDPYHLFLMLKDLKSLLDCAPAGASTRAQDRPHHRRRRARTP
jgi:GNAT superfamily N-acetyltransferase